MTTAMYNLKSLSKDQLQTLLLSSREVLLSVIASLDERPDIQAGITRLMSAGEMVEELSAINEESPGLARLILQVGVAALVNGQSVLAIERELRVRAAVGN